VPYVVIETDPDIVKSLRARGVPAVFGDAAQRVILAAARAERAALVILTVPETERARLAVRRLRVLNPGAPVLARAWALAGRDRRRRGAGEWWDGASSDRRHGPAHGRPLAALRPAPEDRRAPGRIRGAQRISETL